MTELFVFDVDGTLSVDNSPLTDLDKRNNDIDDFASEINNFAKLLGKELGFNTQEEFDDFMATDKPLIL